VVPAVACTVVLVAVAAVRSVVALAPTTGADGRRLYTAYCAPCHGASGRGDGPDAAMFAEPPRNLRDGFLDRYTRDDLVRRVREGRVLALTLDPPALRAHATNVEALVSYLRRLPSIDWPRAAAGREIYADRCVPCHGPYGRPGKTLPAGVGAPRDLSDVQVQASIGDKQLAVLVRHGRSGMPALVPRVADADGPPLVAFVRLLSPGFAMYDRYCASCHGDDGHPASGNGEVLRLPSVVFNRAYFATRDADELRSRAWHMLAEQKPAMPHYRWTLTEAQAAAIIEYLQHLP
jgi:mono/diheme cytochrome c family protein